MNAERLLRLADHLETVPWERFNLGVWHCGSVACAVGHACAIPEFAKAGLHLVECFDEQGELRVVYKNCSEWEAPMQFFDLYSSEVVHLFSSDSYGGKEAGTSPREVACRIREFVVEHQPVIKTGEMPFQWPVLISMPEAVMP